jgi:hydroxymethylbilane synthase
VGAHAVVSGETLELWCYVGRPDGSDWIGDRVSGDAGDPEAIGQRLADRVLAAGAADLLRALH